MPKSGVPGSRVGQGPRLKSPAVPFSWLGTCQGLTMCQALLIPTMWFTHLVYERSGERA